MWPPVRPLVPFATVGGLESAGRLLLMLAVALLIPSLAGLEMATVIPMGLWLILALVTFSGRRLGCPRGCARGPFDGQYPLVVPVLGRRGDADDGLPERTEGQRRRGERTGGSGHPDSGDFITRSPIMIPLQAFQGVAVSAFLAAVTAQWRRSLPPAAVVAVGAVGVGGLPGGSGRSSA